MANWDLVKRKQWYLKNKERLNEKRRSEYRECPEYRQEKIDRALLYRADINEWLRELKLKLGCQNCGYKKHHVALDFHHVSKSDKDFNIGGKIMSKEKIEKELKKCIVLCCNCHKVHHFEEGWLHV